MNRLGQRSRPDPPNSPPDTLRLSDNRMQQKMSAKTRGFLEKICYRRAAYVDMTQHGFISDSKASPVNLLLRPLKDRLEKICGPGKTRKKTVGTDVKKKGARKGGLATSRSVAAKLPRRANKVAFVRPSKK